MNFILIAGIIFILSILAWVKPESEYSLSERRGLKKFPKLTINTVFTNSGSNFMDEFEKYAVDQFPFRESFRTMHSFSNKYLFGKKAVNDLYVVNNGIYKLDGELNQDSINWSANRMNYVYDTYLQNDADAIGLAIIPNKSYYLPINTDYPRMDFDSLNFQIITKLPSVIHNIDIKKVLTLDSYYRTDTHWRQEELIPVAQKILKTFDRRMDITNFDASVVTDTFQGVYYGQLALPMEADTLICLSNDVLNQYSVNCYDSGEAVPMTLYDMDRLKGHDPYEVFLSGSKSLVTIENPSVTDDSHLILFRDSFGSSIAPLLATVYEKVTLVDIRYISPAILDKFISFDGADVLFLYSAQILNSSVGQFIR